MNHGPDAKGPEGPGPDLDGFDSDEQVLRRMLHSAVDDIAPSGDTLDRLRRAVPARRARKRQAAVGMAAAALFIGTAIPALVHVSAGGGTDPNTAIAGQSSQAHGGGGHDKATGSPSAGPRETGSTDVQPGKETGKPDDKGTRGGGPGSTGGAADPTSTLATGAPLCTAAQLGSATGTADAPDSAGIVYGTFRVANVSADACTVSGAGTIGATAQGAADPAKITRVRHTAGDAATNLPDPSLEVSALVLQPGSAYEEKFAFVPSETCPTTGGGSTGGPDPGDPTPDPTPTGDTGASGATGTGGATSGTGTQLLTEDGTADGDVLITHAAQPGSPTASTVVPKECAGTVYYTGVLPGA
ncbi:hypothetical protein [Streptomyces sp. NPDC051452]|uniref:hypothetical protein n=1 Tax=Streptomyces sp. NPDC051452 TaxID=3365654 RepID=UPI0037AEFEAB